jgi:hypothetical protein
MHAYNKFYGEVRNRWLEKSLASLESLAAHKQLLVKGKDCKETGETKKADLPRYLKLACENRS